MRIDKIFVFLLLIIFCNSSVEAQSVRQFKQHEIIDAGNGLKIEILQCKGLGDNDECDVIYYTEKRQQGKRQWEVIHKIKEQEQQAKLLHSQSVPEKIIKVEQPKEPVVKATEKPTRENEVLIDSSNREAPKNIEAFHPETHNIIKVSQVYSLEQCYQLALERNTTIKKAQNNINSNIIDYKTAQSNLLPSLSTNFGHYFSFGKNIDPVTNTFINQNFSGGYASLSLELELFQGFYRINTIRQSAYMVASAESAMKKAELELLTNVTLTYARLLLSKEQILAQQTEIESTEKQLAVINEKIKVGRLTKYEAYAFEALLNTENANIVTIQNDSSSAVQDLKHLLNINYKQPVDISPIDSVALSKIYSSTIYTTDFIDSVLIAHPAVKQAKLDEQVAELGLKIAKSNLYPTLSVGGNIVTNYNVDQTNLSGQKIPFDQQLNNNIGKNVNISLHVPIFSQMQNANQIKKQELNISTAKLNMQETQDLIVTNTLQLINDFNASRQKYIAILSARDQNILSYSMYLEKYKLGQISSLELLNARSNLNNAITQYLQAKLEIFFKFKLLQLLKS